MSGRRSARLDFSKQLIRDIRGLLWVVTVGGLGLAALCLYHTKCNPNKAQHPKSIAPQLFF